MKMYDKLVNSIESLSFMPERYRLYEELYNDIELRVMVVDKYKVFYHVDINQRFFFLLFATSS